MTCDQARELLEELARENRSWQEVPELAEHMRDCQACRQWYADLLQVDQALHQLPAIPVPPDFSQRVLSRLSRRTPRGEARATAGARPAPGRWQAFWEALAHPRGRRQMVPVLVAAACVVLVVGLVYGLLAGNVPAMPGAAAGSLPWPLVAGAGVVLILLVVGLILWQRRR
jgi:negative regulator of sigma E activity